MSSQYARVIYTSVKQANSGSGRPKLSPSGSGRLICLSAVLAGGNLAVCSAAGYGQPRRMRGVGVDPKEDCSWKEEGSLFRGVGVKE